jgi:hypothetical protein
MFSCDPAWVETRRGCKGIPVGKHKQEFLAKQFAANDVRKSYRRTDDSEFKVARL